MGDDEMKRIEKKFYEEPIYEIEKFTVLDVITSSSQDDHDQPLDPDDEF